jgi:hypothetical protein
MTASAAEPAAEQPGWCAEAVAARPDCTALTWAGIDDLLLDRVVAGGSGHPLTLAVVCVEAARRAGVELGVVAGRAGCFVAHPRQEEPLLLDVARGRLVEAGGRIRDVGWQCAHQVAARSSTASASERTARGTSPGPCARPSCGSPCRSPGRFATSSSTRSRTCAPG